jgi:hypothetical protein
MTRAEIEAMLDRHREAFASRDAARLAADHTEDGTFSSPAAGTVRGRARIRDVYEYWLDAFPDMQFTWGPPIIEGQRVALFWRFGGTLSGKFYGEARAGTRIEFNGAAEYVLSPEGIVAANHLFDFTGTLVNAGVLKVKPA